MCSEQCSAFKESCLAKANKQPPTHNPSPSTRPLSPHSHSHSPSVASRILANKRPRKRTSQPTRYSVPDDDHPQEDTSSPTGQPSRSVTVDKTYQPTSQPSFITSDPSRQPSSQPSTSIDDASSPPTSPPSAFSSRKPSSKKLHKSPIKSTHRPTHRPSRHATSHKPTSHAPTPTCESLYTSCLARCPIVLPYTMYSAFEQFSCFEVVVPSAAPTATRVITLPPTIGPTTLTYSSFEIVQVHLISADITPVSHCWRQ